jgi:hypothetical protein
VADLPEALDQALREYYPVPEVKRAATHRQGLTARMNQLEKQFQQPGDRKGAAGVRAAKEAGISPRTWQKWKAGVQKPGARLLQKLEGAYARFVQHPKMKRRVNTKGAPNLVKVTAKIKWSSSPKKNYNKVAQRTTTLEGMRGVMVGVIRAWATAGPEAAADALERGAASVYRADEIRFEGDHVEIEFP